MFKSDRQDLFNVVSNDALEQMKDEEDKTFLIKQWEDTLSCSMGGVNKCLADEKRKHLREVHEQARERCSVQMDYQLVASSSAIIDSDDSTRTTSAVSSPDDEYKSASVSKVRSPKKKMRKILTEDVVALVDRVNISDRKALFVVRAVAHALGHPASELSLSCSRIQNTWKKFREPIAIRDAIRETDSFSSKELFLLHWDAKLLPDVDHVAVLVTWGSNF